MDFELAGSIFLGQKRFDFMVRALVIGLLVVDHIGL
jgi:hypothetical protein